VPARLRLPARPSPPGPGAAAGPGPVVLFLPAHDEEATVASVVGRVPERVGGHPVRCLVVDDGSGDRTAELAEDAGALVLGSAGNQGLGAAVRRGLQAAAGCGAVAVAFCDADGEYDPGELERLVAPILEGRADYVVGSRFAGEIRRMLPHRRLGNRLLTRLLGFVARVPIGDGQSGFRALSRAAAADAEILHDYNYAQVLTLDLLAKGYRYLEVPPGQLPAPGAPGRLARAERSRWSASTRMGQRGAGPRRRAGCRRPGRSPEGGIAAGGRSRRTAGVDPSVLHDVAGEAGAGVGPGGAVEGAVLVERVGRRPRHRQGVVGVVVGEQAEPAEAEQGRLGGRPGVQRLEGGGVAGAVHRVGVRQPPHRQ
jgi:hypothetical protein